MQVECLWCGPVKCTCSDVIEAQEVERSSWDDCTYRDDCGCPRCMEAVADAWRDYRPHPYDCDCMNCEENYYAGYNYIELMEDWD